MPNCQCAINVLLWFRLLQLETELIPQIINPLKCWIILPATVVLCDAYLRQNHFGRGPASFFSVFRKCLKDTVYFQ